MQVYECSGEQVSALISLCLIHLQWKTALHQTQ